MVRACAVLLKRWIFGRTMSEKNFDSTGFPFGDPELEALYEELRREFPSVAEQAEPYDGPPEGFFRATDVVQVPPALRPAFRTLGRLYWRTIRGLLAGGPGESPAKWQAGLAELTAAVAEELRFAARVLAIGTAAHQALGRKGTEPELEKLAGRSLRRIEKLVRGLDEELATLRSKAVSGARRVS